MMTVYITVLIATAIMIPIKVHCSCRYGFTTPAAVNSCGINVVALMQPFLKNRVPRHARSIVLQLDIKRSYFFLICGTITAF